VTRILLHRPAHSLATPFPRPALERLETRTLFAAGEFIESFGNGGTVYGTPGLTRQAEDVAVLPDGRTLVVGSGDGPTSRDFTVARYNVDGTPDTTFGDGGDGIAHTDFWGLQDDARKLIVIGSKFLVAGTATSPEGPVMAIARFHADGTRDMTFGNNGRVAIRISDDDKLADAVLQPDGKILLLGDTVGPESRDIALARFHFNGGIDDTFGGGDGVAVFNFGDSTNPGPDGNTPPSEDLAMGVGVQSTGKIVVLSARGHDVGTQQARFNADGSVDTSFGSNGIRTQVYGAIHRIEGDILIQPDDKIVYSTTLDDGYRSSFWITRLSAADGLVDGSFGTGGGRNIPKFDATYAHAMGLGLQTDGKIVQVGSIDGYMAVVRYTANGRLDSTFMMGGLMLAKAGSGGTVDMPDRARGVAFGPDGDITVAGGRVDGHSFQLMRLDDQNTTPTTFPAYPTIVTDVSDVTLNSLGMLRIVGTEGNDTMGIRISGTIDHNVFGRVGTFGNVDLSTINEILFVGMGGNDTIIIEVDGNYGVQVQGGDGNDTIIGGIGDDTLIGNLGQDHIEGGLGDDVIDGYGGHDRLIGNLGNDRLYGGSGVDLLESGPGNDRLHAGPGDDAMAGGVGSDTLYGEAGRDTINGGSGGAGNPGTTDHALDASVIDAVSVIPAVTSPLRRNADSRDEAETNLFDELEAMPK
jgi:uncharacterized delta-60 repeat protein